MDDAGGQGGLEAIFAARRRIVAAFEGIAAGSEALALLATATPDTRDADRLQAELAEERRRSAGLAARLAELEAQESARQAEMDAVLAELVPIVEEAR